jgi:hypothetical protein
MVRRKLYMKNNRKHHEFAPSSLDRIANCPGSYNLSKTFEDVEYEDAFRDEGNLLHEFMAGVRVKLSQDQLILCQKSLEYEEVIIGPYKDAIKERCSEYDLVVTNGKQILTEGTCDRLYIIDSKEFGRFGILIDWKFGSKKVEAARNFQFMAYSTAAIQEFELEYVLAYAVMPRINFVSNAKYTDNARLIEQVIIEAKKGQTFSMGEHCTYCPALKQNKCPINKIDLTVVEKESSLTELTDDDLSSLFERTKIISKMIDKVKLELKNRIIKSENGICGNYKIIKKPGNREVTNTQGLINFLIENHNFAVEEILPLVKIPVPDIENLFIKKTVELYGNTQKNAKELFKLATTPYIEQSSKEEIVKNE